MNVGTIITAECVNQPTPPDARCQDPAFALANPTLCPVAPFLLIKPGVALTCALGCMQFRSFYVKNGKETDVTTSSIFSSSNTDVFVIGATSGAGTGIALGNVIITATYQGLSAQAQLDVIGSSNDCHCCDNTKVATMVVVDNSRSMSLNFGGVYASRLAFAKVAANRYISETNQSKDLIGLMKFNADDDVVLSSPTLNKNLVQSFVNPIPQTQSKTTFFDALTTAISELGSASANLGVIVLISDGEDTTTSYIDFPNPIQLLSDFKANGGIVICVGCRASGEGFALLSNLATPGFFINSYPGTDGDALNLMSGLKGYICAGNCTPAGDVIANKGQLNYTAFANWNVVGGFVDLQGNCFFDYLPGNGLYVDLISGAQPSGADNGRLVIKTPFAIKSGHSYRISVDLAGNQLVDRAPDSARVQVYYLNNDVNQTPIYLIDQQVSISEYRQDFHTYSFTFTAPADQNVYVAIQQEDHPQLVSRAGLLLNRVKLDDLTDLTNLLDDTFDTENPVYVPPRCGIGTTQVYTGAVAVFSPDFFTDGENEFLSANAINMGAAIADHQYRITATFTSESCGIFPSNASQLQPTLTYTDFGGNVQTLPFGPPITINNCTPVHAGPIVFPGKASTPITITFPQVLGGSYPPDTPFHQTVLLEISLTTKPGYGYAYGYCCYGTGCLTSPPPSQLSDPFALPDIESGNVTGPQTFTSTKTACATCPSGTINAPGSSLVPVMTSDTTPSGVASASSNNATAFQAFDGVTAFNSSDLTSGWRGTGSSGTLQYKFAAAQVVDNYSVTIWKADYSAPRDFKLQGSNDGSAWTDLDTRSSVNWFMGETKNFQFTNTTAYLYYRLNVSATIPHGTNPDIVVILEMTLAKAAPAQVCKDSTATSSVSQADADNQAYAAALALAQAELNCQQIFSSTEQFTATCPVGSFGVPVTKSASATSLVSQAEADQAALIEATAEAKAALNCTLSNNDQQIIINDSNGSVSAATPFPSVKYVTGAPVSVTKVTVTLKGFTHSFPDDVLIMLLHQPTGKTCYLLANAGGNIAANNIDVTFDDAAGGQIPNAGPMVAGAFQCSAFLPAANLPSPSPIQPYGANLAVFNGINGNGSWALFVGDDTSLNSGNIALGWDLTIV